MGHKEEGEKVECYTCFLRRRQIPKPKRLDPNKPIVEKSGFFLSIITCPKTVCVNDGMANAGSASSARRPCIYLPFDTAE